MDVTGIKFVTSHKGGKGRELGVEFGAVDRNSGNQTVYAGKWLDADSNGRVSNGDKIGWAEYVPGEKPLIEYHNVTNDEVKEFGQGLLDWAASEWNFSVMRYATDKTYVCENDRWTNGRYIYYRNFQYAWYTDGFNIYWRRYTPWTGTWNNLGVISPDSPDYSIMLSALGYCKIH